jgi:hypothetical protein
MNRLTSRLHRFARIAAATVSLVVLALSAALAEGWGDVGGPKGAPSLVTADHIVYDSGSELFPDGTYICDSVTHHMPAAAYDTAGNLHYSEGTVLHPNGTWESSYVP